MKFIHISKKEKAILALLNIFTMYVCYFYTVFTVKNQIAETFVKTISAACLISFLFLLVIAVKSFRNKKYLK